MKNIRALAPRFFKFCVVGGTGALLQLAITWLFTEKAHVYYLVSQVFAIFCALIWTFAANNLWTFRDRKVKK